MFIFNTGKKNSWFPQRERVSGCTVKRFASTGNKKNELENFQSFLFGINEAGFLSEQCLKHQWCRSGSCITATKYKKGRLGHEPPEENWYDANSWGYHTSTKVTVNHRTTASFMLENTVKIIESNHWSNEEAAEEKHALSSIPNMV